MMPLPLTNLAWTVPFVGLLMSLAVIPSLAPSFWHRFAIGIVGFWALMVVIPLAQTLGIPETGHALLHTALHDYIPFGLLCWTLFALSSGIHVRVGFAGTPVTNAVFLAAGSLMASLMGTTGASILLIRPFLAMNAGRAHQKHLVIFFIVLVSNIGGVLSPIGDPPLFLGYLNGVDFFWITHAALGPFAVMTAGLLLTFLVVDAFFARREGWEILDHQAHRWSVRGYTSMAGFVAVIAVAALSGAWTPSAPHLPLWEGLEISAAALARDLGFVAIAAICLWLGQRSRRAHANTEEHDWAPLKEVLILFAGLFITLIPVFLLIHQGPNGPFHALFTTLFNAKGEAQNSVFFWITGALSSFLDNAPTYLVFFNLAGGDAQALMHHTPSTLLAISCGAVFMGALTYIGNAPNLMVASMARTAGVRIPSFFGYAVIASLLMLPLLTLMNWLFFRP